MEDAGGKGKEVVGCDWRRGRRSERDPGENSQRSNVWRRNAQIAARIFAETNFRAGGASADVEGRKIKVRRRIARALRLRRANVSGFILRSHHCPTGGKDSGQRAVVAALREMAEAVCDSEGKTR